MKTSKIILTVCILTFLSCQQNTGTIDKNEFILLMNQLADSWTSQDTDSAIECFASDAIYMQPPDQQFYKGHEQLRPFFGALEKGTVMKFHNIWFDKEKQMGAAEFTFGNSGSVKAVTGVTIVTVEERKIKKWREYFIAGPINFDDFISLENKEWKWTIENYP